MTTSKDSIQEEALAEIAKHRRCSVGISMGVGKTLIGLLDMERTNGNFLVVAPKLSILSNWKLEAVKHNLSHLLDRIEFTTYLSLEKKPMHYSKIYLDECHSLTMNNSYWLDMYGGDILGLTGTPPVLKGSEKGRLVNTYCPIVYTYIVDDAVEANILNDYKIYVHYLDLDTKKNIRIDMKNGKFFYTSEVDQYKYMTKRVNEAITPQQAQISRIHRMKALQTFKSKEEYARQLINEIQDKCLIFANTKQQADSLCDYSYHSSNPDSFDNLDMFKAGHITKLSCVLQLNEGVNIPGLKQSVVLHAYGNERKFAQRLGRCLRLPTDELAIVHILCYANTIDEEWIRKALSGFNQDKIVKLDYDIIS